MKTILIFCCSFFLFSASFAQTIEAYYEQEKYQELAAFAGEADSLSTDQLYMIGYAFFRLEKDMEAIEMYDKAIEKGLDEDFIYFYRGLSYRYLGKNKEAIQDFERAVERDSGNQRNVTELGNCYFFQGDFETAIPYYEKARELDYQLGDPYLKLPLAYNQLGNTEKALEESHLSMQLIDPSDPGVMDLVSTIGLLSYIQGKHEDAIDAYSMLLELDPGNYDLFPSLIKAYYGNQQYEQGDSLIAILVELHAEEDLPERFMKYGRVAVDEFSWEGRGLVAFKSLTPPENTLDVIYTVYLLSENGEEVEHTYLTEQTIQLTDDGPKHLFCARAKDGTHFTYTYGWKTDDIKYTDMKEAVIEALKGELTPGASSNFQKKKNEKSN